MIQTVTLRDALASRDLLGNVLAGPSWATWRTFLIAAMGEALTDAELATFREFTGRDQAPSEPVAEAAFICGRRAGKDRAASVLASYIAGLCDHPALVRGERGVVLIIAPDTTQSAVQLGYIAGALESSPRLGPMVERQTSDCISLANGVDVVVKAANFRRLRGPTCVAVIASESAFWMSAETSANPDTEILNAVRPSLLTTGGPLIQISSPYAKRGELHRVWKDHYGPQGDPRILVACGATTDFNPTADKAAIARAYQADPASAAAEFGAQFRTDVSAFISRDVIEACIARGVLERPPADGTRYVAHIDPSGGSVDSFCLAIAHNEGGTVIVDALREARPPFSPEGVVAELSSVLKRYGVREARSDRYGAEFVVELFRKQGITIKPSEKSTSDLFVELIPALNTQKIELLDHERANNQIVGLERRTGRSGKDSIGHGPGGHDDLATVVAGAAFYASGLASRGGVSVQFYDYGGVVNTPANTTYRGDALSGRGGRNDCEPGRASDRRNAPASIWG